MKDYLPKSELEPGEPQKGPTTQRKIIWLVVGGLGVYLIVSGIWGIVTTGG